MAAPTVTKKCFTAKDLRGAYVVPMVCSLVLPTDAEATWNVNGYCPTPPPQLWRNPTALDQRLQRSDTDVSRAGPVMYVVIGNKKESPHVHSPDGRERGARIPAQTNIRIFDRSTLGPSLDLTGILDSGARIFALRGAT